MVNQINSIDIFSDSEFLSEKLKELAIQLEPGDAYYLKEAAIHINALYSHLKYHLESKATNNNRLSGFSKALNDAELSFECKGMLLYLHSLDDINNISMAKLIETAPSGRDKTRRIFKELVSKGFVNKYLDRDELGRFSHDVFYLNNLKLQP